MEKADTRLVKKVLLTPQEGIEYTGIARTRFYELLRTRAIPSARVGRTKHIRRTDLDTFMEERIEASQ